MSTATRPPSRTQYHRAVKEDLTETPHPEWVEAMTANLAPEWTGVLKSPLFAATTQEPFPAGVWRGVLLEFFCVVEAFPKYMGAYLARTTFGQKPGDILARDWLIGNIRTEALHAQWYIDWGAALGISYEEMVSHRPGPEVGALYEFLWSMAYRGSLAEAFGAINYAIEGVTGDWTRLVLPAFKEYCGDDKHALMWLIEHAEYDDAHPREALELIKITAREDEREQVEAAIRRSLELFRRAFDAMI
ncbi:TenA family transcriptional regulator [Actinomadura sp. HBU206391]|uniref:TenA family transcriptional regulator n=1 Tax=Actinomadura sp. HBU206391 TaxID=2731692 RepID=UPI001650470F|nr:iron-containing redox enzyme family protein [Actinomadura sp. HBU206391]MBC6459389.1 iron-containing redox enzyme family protein [Actinomadura sp. HBU206391]